MLKIENICKKYGAKLVLNDVSFEVPNGQVCALLGLNGAGKSTLMKIICMLARANSGNVEFDGKALIDNTSGEVGFMIEAPKFYNELTGRGNLVSLSFLFDSIPKERIDEVLALTGLEEHADVSYKKYSLGMKQRLYFAYALLNKPRLIVLDEPFNGVDPVTVRHFQNLITDLAKSGCTVLISGHMISEIQAVSDRAIILDHGEVVYQDEDIHGKDLTETFLSLVSESGAAQ